MNKKILSRITDSSMYRYPYENLSLVDMEGEIWKPMPNYEDYYMVSNKGRVKSLPRKIEHSNYTTEERIKKQTVHKFLVCNQTYNYKLQVGTKVNGKSGGFIVCRLVYEAFVGSIPDQMIMRHKNGDPFDNSPENLYPISRKEFMRNTYEKNRDIMNKKRGKYSEIIISQYDLEGNYIKTHRSLSHAAKAIGTTASHISGTVKGKNIICKGYCLRRGDSKDRIDMSFYEERLRQRKQKVSETGSKKVVQYDITGKFIAVHGSIRKAAAQTGISVDCIIDTMRGRYYQTRGFIWRYADSFDKIPDKIEVRDNKLPEPAVFTKSRKEMNLPEYEYPYQDLHLCDMENEVWKAVPGLEEYCMVSNTGRLKALPRFVDRGNNRRTLNKERIIKQDIQISKRKQHTGKLNRWLSFSININNIAYFASVARVVYSAFIQPLKGFKEDKIHILHRDSNTLNNRVENLYAAVWKKNDRT